ncbi:MAG: hypothetical protein ACRDYF_20745, partial [Acidimicrobiia bacterium]
MKALLNVAIQPSLRRIPPKDDGHSKLCDPLLVPNLVFSPQDQRWSALDARPLFGWAKSVGYLYEAQL